jgi:hypothetical protein
MLKAVPFLTKAAMKKGPLALDQPSRQIKTLNCLCLCHLLYPTQTLIAPASAQNHVIWTQSTKRTLAHSSIKYYCAMHS